MCRLRRCKVHVPRKDGECDTRCAYSVNSVNSPSCHHWLNAPTITGRPAAASAQGEGTMFKEL